MILPEEDSPCIDIGKEKSMFYILSKIESIQSPLSG